jgi:hypothetical protein
MSNPQQPELRRSAKGESVEDSQKLRVGREEPAGKPHGSDKGSKGGGPGGGVPPDQQSPHPS